VMNYLQALVYRYHSTLAPRGYEDNARMLGGMVQDIVQRLLKGCTLMNYQGCADEFTTGFRPANRWLALNTCVHYTATQCVRQTWIHDAMHSVAAAYCYLVTTAVIYMFTIAARLGCGLCL